MSGLETIGLIAGLAGSAVSAVGTIAAGQAQQSAANYEAVQLEAKAKSEAAAAQREAQEYNKKTNLALSRQQAVAGASGFSATDQSVLDLAGETAARGRFQSLLALYGGEDRAEGMKAQANATRASGRAAATGSYFGAGGTILSGASTFFDKYGKLNPNVGAGYA